MTKLETVRLGTQPAEHWNTWRDVKIPYQKIVSLSKGEDAIQPQVRTAEPVSEREIVLPRAFAERLVAAARFMAEGWRLNCHKFARIMVGEDGVVGSYDKQLPLTDDFRSRPRVANLPAGAIGMIGASGFGVMHSLVGLGTETSESIQVMSGQGEFGIADNEEVLNWYRWICEDDEVYIHQYQ